MKKHFALNALLTILVLALVFMGTAQAQARPKRLSVLRHSSYSILSLGTLPGFTRSTALGLNDKGEVVGSLDSGQDNLPSHVFLWSERRLHDFGTIPSPYSAPNAPHPFTIEKVSLNNRGMVVVSWSVFFDGAYMGTRQVVSVRRDGRWKDLPLLPLFQDNAEATVNERGDIALTADHTSNTRHADSPPYDPPHVALYRGGRLMDLGPGHSSGINNKGEVCGFVAVDAKGAPRGLVNVYEERAVIAFKITAGKRERIGQGMTTAINDQGVIVELAEGVPTDQGYSFAKALPARWQDGELSLLPVPQGEHAVPAAINNRGQIVGGHWLWEGNRRYDLNPFVPESSGWTHLQANAINNLGQIAGWGRFHGKRRAFLMTPAK